MEIWPNSQFTNLSNRLIYLLYNSVMGNIITPQLFIIFLWFNILNI